MHPSPVLIKYLILFNFAYFFTCQDYKIIEAARDVIQGDSKVVNLDYHITNLDRTVGATVSNLISMHHVEQGLPPDRAINIALTGSAGQSFCAFTTGGVHVTLEGDANDYVGKGLCGGEVVVFPPKNSAPEFKSEDNIIVGNVCLYGATTGKAFFRGQAAERFCVRNSGATAVCEGCGDHGCEYMTGGRAIILGETGRNFAAGMSGGIAYVLDTNKVFRERCNLQSVDLLAVESEEDLQWLKEMLTEFKDKTGSEVAAQVLATWPAMVSDFIKVGTPGRDSLFLR